MKSSCTLNEIPPQILIVQKSGFWWWAESGWWWPRGAPGHSQHHDGAPDPGRGDALVRSVRTEKPWPSLQSQAWERILSHRAYVRASTGFNPPSPWTAEQAHHAASLHLNRAHAPVGTYTNMHMGHLKVFPAVAALHLHCFKSKENFKMFPIKVLKNHSAKQKRSRHASCLVRPTSMMEACCLTHQLYLQLLDIQ